MMEPIAMNQSRVDQMPMIAEPDRPVWLAGEIDSLDEEVQKQSKRLNQILAGVIGVLLTTLSTLITLVLSGVSA